MAFVPSAKDFESSEQGFVPTAEHFENNENQQLASESLLQRLKQVPGNILKSVEHEAIGMANPFISLGNVVSENIHNILPESLANPNYKKMENIPEPEGYEEIKNSPEAWAAFGLPLASGAYGLGKLGLRGLSSVGSKLAPSISRFTGKEASEKSGNIINDLLGGHNLNEYHEPILGKVRQNYASNIESGSKEYNEIKELANREGYKGQSQLSRALGEKNAKSINDSVLHKLEKLDIDKGSSLSTAVENFKRNPSFKAAHELQSELGKEGASKIKSLDSGDASLGRSLMSARKDLISDIEKTFEKNKDIDLLNRYKAATNHWYEKVRPYLENNTIKNIVTKKGIQEINPTNLDTLLSKADESVEHVLSELPQEYKNLIIAKKLSPAIEESGLYGRQVDPTKLVKKFNSLKNTPYKKFMTPEHSNAITDLEKSLRFSDKYGLMAKNATKKGAVGALSGLGIYETLKKLGIAS